MPLIVDSERTLAACCMCFSIKTGCKIIGTISLLFSAMHLIMYTMLLIQVESNLPRCYEMLERGETSDHLLLNNCFQHSIWLVRAALLLGCLLYLFGLIGSAMLLKGIAKKLPKLFYAWFLFCTVIIIRNLMSYGTFHDVNQGMQNLVFCLVLVYFFCIVKYHERQLLGFGGDDIYGINNSGSTALQQVTTYPGQAVLPKDNPPPYSMVVDCSPPPYSACVSYYPEGPSTNQPLSVEEIRTEISAIEQNAEVDGVQQVTSPEAVVRTHGTVDEQLSDVTEQSIPRPPTQSDSGQRQEQRQNTLRANDS